MLAIYKTSFSFGWEVSFSKWCALFILNRIKKDGHHFCMFIFFVFMKRNWPHTHFNFRFFNQARFIRFLWGCFVIIIIGTQPISIWIRMWQKQFNSRTIFMTKSPARIIFFSYCFANHRSLYTHCKFEHFFVIFYILRPQYSRQVCIHIYI